MICARCPQRDVCDLAGKDDPLLTGCDASHGTWAFDRLRLDRMTADRDALRAELERTKEELERARRNHLRRMEDALWIKFDRAVWERKPFLRFLHLQKSIRAALERKGGA